MRNRPLVIVLALSFWLLALPLAAAEFRVLASIKPIHSVLAALMQGGDAPLLLYGDGQSPHAERLSAAQKKQLQGADLLIWVGPELERGLAQGLSNPPEGLRVEALLDSPSMKILPSRTRDDRRDPYFWLDNRNISILVDDMTLLLQEMDPLRAHLYSANRIQLHDRLRKIDREMENSYRGFKAAPALQYLDTLQYFEQAYALKVVDRLIERPEEQAAAEKLLQLRQLLQDGRASCLLLEAGVSDSHAATLTQGIRLRTAELDSLGQGLEPGPDHYFNLMQKLADGIRSCLALAPVEATEKQLHTELDTTPIAPGAGVGRFMLTDHLGGLVTNQDMQGKLQILYFGYTFCPDICPTSLAVLGQTLQMLGDKADLIQPWFITVDPERDNTEVMRKYVTYFDPRLVGLTGPKAMIDRLADSLSVKYEKVLEEGKPDDMYVMDHSASLYLLDAQGRYITKFLHGISPEKLHAELLKYLP
ncbi:SCO family protein [Magnetovirga frankeli]|uniref:metal ABC transporter solute-binding protein, Zn/Mn family n=1 Tax=Magnetovirga frankeli TaxID=947516 RepID=UPI001293EC3F|nr:SCO family protein [gamma proteobacterium SS-5]